jgi:antitoxin component YwqK of YwqJK toxin-antitoxin module
MARGLVDRSGIRAWGLCVILAVPCAWGCASGPAGSDDSAAKSPGQAAPGGFAGWSEPAFDSQAALPCKSGTTLAGSVESGETYCETSAHVRHGWWARWSTLGNGTPVRTALGAYENGSESGTFRFWHTGGQPGGIGSYTSGERSGVWTSWFTDGGTSERGSYSADAKDGPWQTWFVGGKPASSGSYKNGVRDGAWTTWYSNGGQESSGQYVGGKLDGAWQHWHVSGKLSDSGSYALGMRVGSWVFYHPNGAKMTEGLFEHGSQTGPWNAWNDDGTLESEGTFEFGFAIGHYRKYAYGGPDGTTYSEGDMVLSQADGIWKEWTLDGKHPLSETFFVDGKASGKFHGWFVDGKDYVNGFFKFGARSGFWQWWYPSGQKQTEGTYFATTAQGASGYSSEKQDVWTEWWPSGQMKSKGAYAGGKKVLVWQYWDESGALTEEKFDVWGNKG